MKTIMICSPTLFLTITAYLLHLQYLSVVGEDTLIQGFGMKLLCVIME